MRPRRRAVDNVVMFGEGDLRRAVASDFMPDSDENQAAAAARFFLDIDNGGRAGDRIAYSQRRMKFKIAARPHAPGQRHGRQKAAALGVAVSANVRLGCEG